MGRKLTDESFNCHLHNYGLMLRSIDYKTVIVYFPIDNIKRICKDAIRRIGLVKTD